MIHLFVKHICSQCGRPFFSNTRQNGECSNTRQNGEWTETSTRQNEMELAMFGQQIPNKQYSNVQ